MDLLLLTIASLTFFFLIFTIIELQIGIRAIKNLKTQTILPKEQLPSVSIIFSALNEESSIRDCMSALLSINYPNFEIIAVNDRSGDQTGEILESYRDHKHLKIIHIDQLPKNWLGKNHALHVASKQAMGEWLLFTDADVIMKDNALSKAVSYSITHQIDHLTIYENHIRPEFWLKVLLLGSYITYIMAMKPWRIGAKWSKKSLGHGAFNLVSKQAYLKCGGHQSIAMECLDDLKLGELIKSHGFKQHTVDGKDLIEREWYSSLKQMIHGFQKNAFAYFKFNLLVFMRDFAFGCIFFLWPLVAALTQRGLVQWINIANILATLCFTAMVAQQFRLRKRFALLYPLSISMLFYTLWNSVLAVYKNNGIIWRDTFYSLQELRTKK